MFETSVGIYALLGLVALGVSLTQFFQIGPPLNNAYIYTPKKDRDKMDLGPIYIQSGSVFFLIGLQFLFFAGALYFPEIVTSQMTWGASLFVILYALGSEIYLFFRKRAAEKEG